MQTLDLTGCIGVTDVWQECALRTLNLCKTNVTVKALTGFAMLHKLILSECSEVADRRQAARRRCAL